MQEWNGNDLPSHLFGWQDNGNQMVTAQGFTQICLREIAGHLKCSCKKHVPHICAHVLKIS